MDTIEMTLRFEFNASLEPEHVDEFIDRFTQLLERETEDGVLRFRRYMVDSFDLSHELRF